MNTFYFPVLLVSSKGLNDISLFCALENVGSECGMNVGPHLRFMEDLEIHKV